MKGWEPGRDDETPGAHDHIAGAHGVLADKCRRRADDRHAQSFEAGLAVMGRDRVDHLLHAGLDRTEINLRRWAAQPQFRPEVGIGGSVGRGKQGL